MRFSRSGKTQASDKNIRFQFGMTNVNVNVLKCDSKRLKMWQYLFVSMNTSHFHLGYKE